MMRTVVLAGAALLAMAGTAHARQWFVYNFQSRMCESRTGFMASPKAYHLEARKLGLGDTWVVQRDPKTNEVIWAMASVLLPRHKAPTLNTWFTSMEYCQSAAMSRADIEDIE
jgi:hypothetical protein